MTSEGANLLPQPGKPEIVSRQIDFDTVNLIHPQKKTTIVYQQTNNGSQTVNFALATPSESIFVIPPGVYNWSKSYLEYTLNVPIQNAANYYYIPRDACDFDTVQLYNYNTNIRIVDLQYANRYVNSVVKGEIDVDKWQLDNNEYKNLVISNQAVADNANHTSPQIRQDGGTIYVNYLEPKYFDESAQGTAMAINRQVPLGLFKRTFLALDKSIAFPDQTALRLLWLPGTSLGWQSTAQDAPQTGATAFTVIQDANLVNLGVTNLRLVMHQEADAQVATDLMEDASKGFKIPISYPWPVRQTINAPTGTMSVTTVLAPSNGFKLQRTYVVPYRASGANNQYYDHANNNTNGNTGAQKVGSVQTFLNNNPIQQSLLDCSYPKREHWNWVYPTIKNSILGLAPRVYDYHYAHIDAFDGTTVDTKLEGKYDNTEVISGLPLVAENRYEFRAVGNNVGIDFYIFHICQRWLYVAPMNKGGTRVESQAI